MFVEMLAKLHRLKPKVPAERQEFELESVIEKILNYCNIDKLPEGLEHTAIEMAMALDDSLYADSGAIKSIKEGDSQVDFAEVSAKAAGIVTNYTAQLNAYRRIGTLDERRVRRGHYRHDEGGACGY